MKIKDRIAYLVTLLKSSSDEDAKKEFSGTKFEKHLELEQATAGRLVWVDECYARRLKKSGGIDTFYTFLCEEGWYLCLGAISNIRIMKNDPEYYVVKILAKDGIRVVPIVHVREKSYHDL